MVRLAAFALAALSLAACVGDPASDDDVNDDITPAVKDVAVKVLRGVDRASAFSVGEARTLHTQHGVRWTGVYIGGACDGGSGWTVERVKEIHNATSWQFMPIWVGQQSSSICHAHSLTYAQGKLDGAAAAKRMKAYSWEPNRDIPIALDVEAGTYSSSPHNSASYVHGWVTAVHAAGYRAYVYSSPTGLVRFHDDRLGVDGGWVASYFYNGFRNVTPGELHQIGQRYIHSNRAWQYAGDFEVSGVGRVDANTSNLLLAPGPHGTNRVATSKPRVALACGGLEPGEGLVPGASITACDGSSELAMTADGDLELTVGGAVTWTSGTAGVGATAVLDSDGNFAVYDADLELVFDADTGGNPGARLELTAPGLRLVDDDGGELRTF